MTDVSGQTFKYSGRKYTLQARLEGLNGLTSAALNTEAIEVFEYETELNSFVAKGSLTYRDRYGQVDRFMEDPAATCTVFFAENEQKFDGSVTIERLSEVRRVEVQFLVDGVEIVRRDGRDITYKISLVSVNVMRCM